MNTVNLRLETRATCKIRVGSIDTLTCAWCGDPIHGSFEPYLIGGGQYVPLHRKCHEDVDDDLMQAQGVEYLMVREIQTTTEN